MDYSINLNDDFVKDLPPRSLTHLYDPDEKNPSFMKAFHNFCGCIPIRIYENNSFGGEYQKTSGSGFFGYDHLHDRFIVMKILTDWYKSTVVSVTGYFYPSHKYNFSDRYFYLGNPSYKNWIAGKGNRHIKISHAHGNKNDPVMIKVKIDYEQKMDWSAEGFSIEDAFNVAYAKMKMDLLTNRN